MHATIGHWVSLSVRWSVRPSVCPSVLPSVGHMLHFCIFKHIRRLKELRARDLWRSGLLDITMDLYKSLGPSVGPSVSPSFHVAFHPFIRWSIQLSLPCHFYQGFWRCTMALWPGTNKNRDVKYWATRSSVRSFARTAHSFACSALLPSLAPSAALNHLLTRSLRSLPRLWESVRLDVSKWPGFVP